MKKSVALLSVLIFLAGISAVLLSLFTESEKILSQSGVFGEISENSVILSRFEKEFSSAVQDINGSEDLDNLFVTTPLIASKNGDFLFGFEIYPLSDKINLNMIIEEDKRGYLIRYLDKIGEFFEIKDIRFFTELLLDSIDEDTQERSFSTEIALYERNFVNGRLSGFRRFDKIVDYYFKSTDDAAIYSVPWRELIYFGSEEYMIDCERLKPLNAYFLGLSDQIGNFVCDEVRKGAARKIMSALNIKRYSKNELYLCGADIFYDLAERQSRLSLRMELKKKRIVAIER